MKVFSRWRTSAAIARAIRAQVPLKVKFPRRQGGCSNYRGSVMWRSIWDG
jgi:hypothetical protein